ncbi:Nonribosomal peptide synthetase 13 [Bienertia sinuspersici]
MDYRFLLHQLDGHADNRVTEFVTTLWSIWTIRTKALFQGQVISFTSFGNIKQTHDSERQIIQANRKSRFSHQLISPPHSSLLIVDGAWKNHKMGKIITGIGWVLNTSTPTRITVGVVIFALTPLHIVKAGIRDIQAFTDCAVLGNLLAHHQPGPPEVVSLFQSIRAEISFFIAFQLIAVPRSVVTAAHNLAITSRKWQLFS